MRRAEFTCRRIVLIGLLVVVVGGVAIVLIVTVIQSVVAGVGRSQQHQAQMSTFGEAIMTLCQSDPGTTVTGRFPVVGDPPQVLILETGSDWAHVWYDTMPEAWQPQSADDLDLVVCAPPEGVGERAVEEVCRYEDTSATVTRISVRAQVAVLDPASGEVVATRSFPGATPRNCSYSIQENSRSREIIGGLIDNEPLRRWLRQQVQLAVAAQDFDEDLLALCEAPGPVTGSPPAIDGMPRLMVLDTGYDTLHQWHNELDEGWRADADHAPDLIICAQRLDRQAAVDAVETCSYGGNTSSFSFSTPLPGVGEVIVTRYQRLVEVAVIAPESGEVVLSETLRGGRPSGCPSLIMSTTPPDVYGDWPEAATLQRWLQDALTP